MFIFSTMATGVNVIDFNKMQSFVSFVVSVPSVVWKYWAAAKVRAKILGGLCGLTMEIIAALSIRRIFYINQQFCHISRRSIPVR